MTDRSIITHPFEYVGSFAGISASKHRPAYNRFYLIGFWKLFVVAIWPRPFRVEFEWCEGEDAK